MDTGTQFVKCLFIVWKEFTFLFPSIDNELFNELCIKLKKTLLIIKVGRKISIEMVRNLMDD